MTGHDAVVGGARVVTPEGVLPCGWVEVSAGRIAAVGADPAEATTGAPTDHLPGGWLVPAKAGLAPVETPAGRVYAQGPGRYPD